MAKLSRWPGVVVLEPPLPLAMPLVREAFDFCCCWSRACVLELEVLVVFVVSSDMVDDEVVVGNLESLIGVLFTKGEGMLMGFLGILRAKKIKNKTSF